jgi:type VI secretion system protein ImpJ
MTAPTAARPVWTEGMLLSPQHMQQQDLYHEQFVDARLRALSSTPWGALSLAFDHQALKAGTLTLTHFAGVMPDGTPVRIDPQSPARPASRAIAPHFPARAESLLVRLGLPLLREGVANVGQPGDANSPRFRPLARRVIDLTAARSERDLQAAEPAPVLLLGDEPRDEFACLALTELVRDESGAYDMSPGFIPPCLSLRAAPTLLADLQDLVGRAVARRRRLADDRRARATAEPTARDLDRSLHLHAIDRSLGWLRHCADAGDAHPRELYRALLDLAGALMTTAPDGDPADLPAYQYTDLRATFAPLLTLLRAQLSRDVDPVCLEIPLRPHQGSSWLGEFKDERLLRCPTFILAVEVDGDPVVAATEIPAVSKLASWKRITAIVRQNALGVPLRAVLRPPPEIAVQPRHVYFTIDTTDPLWHDLVADRKVAVFLRPPYDPQHARVRLLALPGEEA